MKTARTRHKGFSLLEVILALAILTGAITVLGELARLGLLNARTARDTAQAQLLCESKLAELTAGLTPVESVSDVPFEEPVGDGMVEWLYSIDVQPTEIEGMSAVTVTVGPDIEAKKKPIHFSLTRWIADEVEEEATEPAAEGMPSE